MLIILPSTLFAEEEIKVNSPKAGIREPLLNLNNWNTASSLSTHFGKGTNTNSIPIFNFNLNLGYIRYYMKSDFDNSSDFNPNFSYIIELKPFDFFAFLVSGTKFSLFIEKNEWLRNFTFIFSNKIYSSTEFISSNLTWYFDLVYNGLPIPIIIIPQSFTSPSALEKLYPANRRESIGISDKFHLYRSNTTAIGLMLSFEMVVPKGTERTVRSTTGIQSQYIYSSDLNFSTLGGIFFRKKTQKFDLSAKFLYQRIQGNYDDQVITVKQNTISAQVDLSFKDQFYFHFIYHNINWKSDQWYETLNSNTFIAGAEVKGFGKKLYWIGFGLDIAYQYMKQSYSDSTDYGKINSILFIPSVNWFPLAFHEKNHQLKISLLYGLIYHSWTKSYERQFLIEEQSGWNYSVMLRINYSF